MSIISAGTSNTSTLVYTGDTTGAMVFQTNGTTEAMRITSAGLVGIGTSNPSSNVTVSGTGTVIQSIISTSGTGKKWDLMSHTDGRFLVRQGTIGYAPMEIDPTTYTVGFNGTSPSLIIQGGIQFPSTQVSSADVNTLDDYEEGTWTPAFSGSSSNPTVSYNFRLGTYVKVGRLVTLNGHLRTSSVSGGSGDVLITGLPFAVDNTSNYTTVGVCYMFNTSTGKYPYYVRLDNGGTSLSLYYGSGTAQSTSFVVSDLGASAFNNETAFTINYLASA